MTDSSGTIVKSYTYDAFGVEENIASSDTNPFRYCGEYYDSEIGQIYLRARYYDPTVGRFTQSDPAMANGMNWYVYCGNDPVNKIDPMGLEEVILRYIIEKNGGSVGWNTDRGTVTIYMPGYAPLEISGKRTVNGRVIVDSEFLVDNFAISQEASTHTFGSNGDLFTSQEDAVLAFGLKYLPIAKNERQEYGAFIKAGAFGTFYIDSINNSALTFGKSIENLTDYERNMVGYNEKEWREGKVHIHWNENPLHPEVRGGTDFSSQDLVGNFAGEELYLIGPFGGVRKAIQYNNYPDSDGRYRNYYQPDDTEIFYTYYGG